MAKFIVIEGTNGSGKQTQATMLTQYFKNLGYKAVMLSFPNYDNEGCTPVKMYLSGALVRVLWIWTRIKQACCLRLTV